MLLEGARLLALDPQQLSLCNKCSKKSSPAPSQHSLIPGDPQIYYPLPPAFVLSPLLPCISSLLQKTIFWAPHTSFFSSHLLVLADLGLVCAMQWLVPAPGCAGPS